MAVAETSRNLSEGLQTLNPDAILTELRASDRHGDCRMDDSKPSPQQVARSKIVSKPVTSRAKFEEENNVVEFEVERHMNEEFPSKGEISDSDSESEADDQDPSQMGKHLMQCRNQIKSLTDRFGPTFNLSPRVKVIRFSDNSPLDKNNNASHNLKLDNTSVDPVDSNQSEEDTEVVLSQPTRDKLQLQRLEWEFCDNNHKMEQKINKLTNALVAVQDLIKKNGKSKQMANPPAKHTPVNDKTLNVSADQESVTTIYCNALEHQ